LIDLHHEFSEGNRFTLQPNFGVIMGVELELDNFFEFESGFVDFDNERFIERISLFRDIAARDYFDASSYVNLHWFSAFDEYRLSEATLFLFGSSDYLQFYMGFKNQIFLDPTPLTNAQDELLIWENLSHVLNANATPIEQAIAWDFIKFAMMDPLMALSSYFSIQPTNRAKFLAVSKRMADELMIFYRFDGLETVEPRDVATNNAIALLEKFGEMPMAVRRDVPKHIWDVIEEAMLLFEEGLVSAEQTAEDLQNRVELALMEMDMLR